MIRKTNSNTTVQDLKKYSALLSHLMTGPNTFVPLFILDGKVFVCIKDYTYPAAVNTVATA